MIDRDRAIVVNRRALLLGGAALLATSTATAQSPGKVFRLAIVHPSHPTAGMTATGIAQYRAFFVELRRRGYVEGQTLLIDRWSADGQAGRYEDLARAIAANRPDVIVASGNALGRALRAIAPTTPIVGVFGDPVGTGLAANLARPGGNVTGVSIEAGEAFHGNRLDLLLEAVPAAKRVAYLLASEFEFSLATRLAEVAKRRDVVLVPVRFEGAVPTPAYPQAFAAIARADVHAIFVGTNPIHLTHYTTLIALAAAARLPASYQWRDFVEAGGLMSYAPNLPDLFTRCADYVDRILKGAKPGDLPIQQPEKFELAINLKTAKALGLTIPLTLLARADEVIE